ncbi:hypothetical protein AB1Y20_018870 [Prymnesium parvum]|uniref:Uncharacterized protein n=1 Tax=Prymnesium parvum TaxID=97485 RepID=A0AB34JQR5_PRYPA|mmetsp:Transcript_4475/g.11143  ORF Transcript_4475/g.11143 Transcript_4475/m.11143 type:complete len:105 (+) Transcript_4475:91-405(+)
MGTLTGDVAKRMEPTVNEGVHREQALDARAGTVATALVPQAELEAATLPGNQHLYFQLMIKEGVKLSGEGLSLRKAADDAIAKYTSARKDCCWRCIGLGELICC